MLRTPWKWRSMLICVLFFFLSVHAICPKNLSVNRSVLSSISSDDLCPVQSFLVSPSIGRVDGFYLFSFRSMEWKSADRPYHLTFLTGDNFIPISPTDGRVWKFSALKPLRLIFRPSDSPDLSLEYFHLEWIWMNRSCSIDLPWQWKCNGIAECGADEDDEQQNHCPVVPMGFDLQCRSDEFWCLPSIQRGVNDQRGLCLSMSETPLCEQSTRSMRCDRIFTFYQTDGSLHIKHLTLNRSICVVLINTHRIYLQFHRLSGVDLSMSEGNRSSTIVDRLLIVRLVQFTNEAQLDFTWTMEVCPVGEFACSGSSPRQCYSKAQRCDGHWHCLNGDDELSCFHSCPAKFRCPDHKCFSLSQRCNGYPECFSGFDEENCSSLLCNSYNGSFLCANRRCIYQSWRCDGNDDCGDNSDEKHCPVRLPRRFIAGLVIGLSIFSILFVLFLSCSVKFFSFRRSFRLIARSSTSSTQPVAPPSYNQTIGLTDEHEERLAFLIDHLRSAGFGEVVQPSASASSTSREPPPAYIPNDSTDTDDEKLLIP